MALSSTRVAALAVICMVAPVQADRPLFGYNVYNDGHFYLFPNSSLSWHDARDACADQGGHLVEIGSGAEQTLLEGIIAQIPGEHQHRWIGLNDLQQEGRFVWESTGRSDFYWNWAPNQPDNFPRPGNGINEHCAHLRLEESKWNDGVCSDKFSFICEL